MWTKSIVILVIYIFLLFVIIFISFLWSEYSTVQHWNLGNRHWQRKKEEIQHLVEEYKPDLAFILEANLFENTPQHETIIEGYTIEKPKTCNNNAMSYSRLVLLVKKYFNYEIMKNHMEDDLATIWVKLTKKGNKKVIVGGI